MMSYVELSGDQKPTFKQTLVRELPYEILQEVGMCLNPLTRGRDYCALAGKMGYNMTFIRNMERLRDPTMFLLDHWSTDSESGTVTALIELLRMIKRGDAISTLSDHAYTVVENPRPHIPASTKEPTENDSSVHSFRTGDGDSSLPISEGPSSYRSRENQHHLPTTTSTRPNYDDLDLDEDEELNESIASTCVSTTAMSLGNSYNSSFYKRNECHSCSFDRSFGGDRDGAKSLGFRRPLRSLDSTDERLRRKVGQYPTESSDGTNSFHPSYTYTKKSQSDCDLVDYNKQYPLYACNKKSSEKFQNGKETSPISKPKPTTSHEAINYPNDAARNRSQTAPPTTTIVANPVVASEKLALLIGNRNYQKIPGESPLYYPHKDVYDFTNALKELGFKTMSLVDLNYVQMRTSMLSFSKLLGKGVFAVFYFAGHGFEDKNENYLMPVDASPQRHADELIVAQEILREMQLRKTSLNLCIIDACRGKGVRVDSTSNCGLRHGAEGNTIIAYSCQSTMPAFELIGEANGVYMTELLKRIRKDERIEHILLDVNTAVRENPHIIQRPVFESDSAEDCRLTCKIDFAANMDLWSRHRSVQWSNASIPPEPQTFCREEKVDIKFIYKAPFCNVLEIIVYLINRNELPIQISNICLLNGGGELEIKNRSLNEWVLPSAKQTEVCIFTLPGLQTISEHLLLVLQLQYCMQGSRDLLNLEMKVNAGFPLISAHLREFREWMYSPGENNNSQEHKNTWV